MQDDSSQQNQTAGQETAQSFGIKSSNIVPDLVMVALGVLILALLVAIIVFCYKKVYPRMPRLL